MWRSGESHNVKMKKGSWSVIIVATIIVCIVLGFSLYKVIDESHNKMITIVIDYCYEEREPEVFTQGVGDTIVVDKNPERDGYTFDGWYADKEYTVKYDFTQKVKDNITIYAKWTEN